MIDECDWDAWSLGVANPTGNRRLSNGTESNAGHGSGKSIGNPIGSRRLGYGTESDAGHGNGTSIGNRVDNRNGTGSAATQVRAATAILHGDCHMARPFIVHPRNAKTIAVDPMGISDRERVNIIMRPGGYFLVHGDAAALTLVGLQLHQELTSTAGTSINNEKKYTVIKKLKHVYQILLILVLLIQCRQH